MRELLVFVASPGDVAAERQAVRDMADEVNASIGAQVGIRLAVWGWESASPEYGRPQGQINPYVDQCDIFIGILATRWGSPTGEYSSGFEEEFRLAATRRSKGSTPEIALFFKQLPQDRLDDPGPELSKVLAFKSEVRASYSLLYGQYGSIDDLKLQLLRRLSTSVLGNHRESPTFADMPGVSQLEPIDAGVPSDPARQEIRVVLGQFNDVFNDRELSGTPDRDRLLLLALSINSDMQFLLSALT